MPYYSTVYGIDFTDTHSDELKHIRIPHLNDVPYIMEYRSYYHALEILEGQVDELASKHEALGRKVVAKAISITWVDGET